MYRLAIRPNQQQDCQIKLNLEQQHYLFRVLRLGTGDRFIALDGLGKSWIAEIEQKSAKIIQEIDVSTELPIFITLISALPKASGYEQVIRCCTELGVSVFSPVISSRTILKPSQNKVERWRKIAIEAAEQAERQIVPQILAPISFKQAIIQTAQLSSDKYICVARGELPSLWNCLVNNVEGSRKTNPQSIVVATGCEGGWTDPEIDRAIACGYQAVSLGNRILRAVTAPITALSLIAAIAEGKKNFA